MKTIEKEIADGLPKAWTILKTLEIVGGGAVEYYSRFGAAIAIRMNDGSGITFCARNGSEPYGDFINSNPLGRLRIFEKYMESIRN